MKNIQVIDGSVNCVYDIFSATNREFSLIFPAGHDIAFIDEVMASENAKSSRHALSEIKGQGGINKIAAGWPAAKQNNGDDGTLVELFVEGARGLDRGILACLLTSAA